MDPNIVIATRLRHAINPEEWRQHPNGMVPRHVVYALAKSKVLEHLRDAQGMECLYVPGDIAAAITAVESGRPIAEPILKSLIGEKALADLFVEAEPDPNGDFADAFQKSEAGDESFVQVILTGVEQVGKADRPLDSSKGLMMPFEQPAMIPVAEMEGIRDRLLRAIAAGDPRVRDTDLGQWPHRLRKAALLAVLGSADELVPLEDGVPEGAFTDPSRPAFFNELKKSAREMNAALGLRGGDELAQTELGSAGHEPASHVASAPHSRVPEGVQAEGVWNSWPKAELRMRIAYHVASTQEDLTAFDNGTITQERLAILFGSGDYRYRT